MLNPAYEHNFRSVNAAGYDNILINMVKESINLICAPLTLVIKLSLNTGAVPHEIKTARVSPLFKSGNNTLFTSKASV